MDSFVSNPANESHPIFPPAAFATLHFLRSRGADGTARGERDRAVTRVDAREMTPTGDLEYTVKTLPASAEEIARCGTLRRRVHEWLASPDRAGKHEDDPELDEILDPSGDAWIRFLRARNGNIDKAFKMMSNHLAWRCDYRPWTITPAEIEHQNVTGKVRMGGLDSRDGRPVLVFDDSKENSKDHAMQLRSLVYHVCRVDRACRRNPNLGKYLLFIHLRDFKLSKAPGRKQSTNTLSLLQDQFPERLGRAILYKPPTVFAAMLSMVKPFMTEVTRNKIIAVTGNVDAGSKNDSKMRGIAGDDWRELTGATMPQSSPEISPGYDHARAWAEVVREHAEEEERRRAWAESRAGRGRSHHEFARSDSVSSMDVSNKAAVVGGPAGGKKKSKLAPEEPGSRRTSHDGSVDVFFDAKETIKPVKAQSWFGF